MTDLNPCRVLLINQSYVPDRGASGRLLGELFERLSVHGIHATVVAGPPTYTDEDIPWEPHEVSDKLTVFRVGSARFRGRKSLLNRLIGYMSFVVAAFARATHLARTREFDVIATASNPPIVGLIGAWCSRVARVPFVYMLHDLHPDMVVKTGRFHVPRFVQAFWNRLNEVIFAGATTIVVLGDSMRTYLVEHKGVPGDKIVVIHPWAVPEALAGPKTNAYRLENELGPDQLMVLYFGNISSTHALGTLINAAAILADRPVQFHLVGGGPEKDELQAKCREMGLVNVSFVPYQSGQRFLDIMAAADVSVTSLSPGLEGLAVPSKTYAIMASGRPVLALCSEDCEVASIVRAAGCGWVCQTPDDVVRAVNEALDNRALLVCYGDRARAWYMEHFSMERATSQYLSVFVDTARHSSTIKD
ncbi:MAG: glycosyltransferase family 4 protein [Bacillota bacterium]